MDKEKKFIAVIVLTISTFGLLDKNICYYLKGSSEFHSQALKINYPEIFLYNKMHTWINWQHFYFLSSRLNAPCALLDATISSSFLPEQFWRLVLLKIT